MMKPDSQRNKILDITTLLEGWSRVVRILYQQVRRDGSVQEHDRDLLDRGHSVTVLLYNLSMGTVLLLRQPRIIATISNFDAGETIEVCNGLMETTNAVTCALREVEEETGHRPTSLTPVGIFYASPGSSLELVHVFMTEYSAITKVGSGGGNAVEAVEL